MMKTGNVNIPFFIKVVASSSSGSHIAWEQIGELTLAEGDQPQSSSLSRRRAASYRQSKVILQYGDAAARTFSPAFTSQLPVSFQPPLFFLCTPGFLCLILSAVFQLTPISSHPIMVGQYSSLQGSSMARDAVTPIVAIIKCYPFLTQGGGHCPADCRRLGFGPEVLEVLLDSEIECANASRLWR